MPQAERAEEPSEPTTGSSGHRRFARAVGLGVVTGAADDDCSAIGTYASAGAQFGTALLWTAPVTFPMMFAVVYLSSKLGQVSGKGLFHVIREIYPRWILWPTLIGVLIGNTIEAAADLGGMAAALQLFIPIATPVIVVIVAAMIVALQLCGSYELIRNIFRWLALALFAYVASALLARPDPWEVLRGTLVPMIHFSRDFLSILVAIIGTSLSAYLYTWQSNVEVEEKIAQGRVKVRERQGSSESDLHKSRMDILTGMLFSNVIMYFIILATGATLFKAGQTNIDSATQAAEALRPLAGDAAGILFAVGIIAVGFLAIPVMTTGAAYDLCQVLGWKSSLHDKPSEAPAFYLVITGFTAAAACLNFLGLNPMRALIYSGIVQGFSTPPLLLFILLITNNRRIMGDKVNSLPLNILSCATVIVIFAASTGLVVTWFI
ncbi:Nramp family divalent metal transporter [Bradyrhizobium sp. BR 10261]|uniref:Nramp family divalent metal transporter n=1 Tax=Bradyrhizobium sp. BR 10261 TaxID=2749992 RepID=UPI001C647B1C|nr:Nramp family divalent metal transporter [Bradyrhizobium sp. BR 10261]MBW7962707.1 Nramp family divalent metal transporter [Bradyrhizobium sp. BR 10261]